MKKHKTYNNLLFFLIFLLIYGNSFSQKTDSLKTSNPIPKRAMIMSACLPGLGQAFNKKYWKIPIVYLGIGSFSYLAFNNQQQFNKYYNAYIIREQGGRDEFYNILNSQALINEMERYRKQRDINLIGLFAFYLIQIVDASVDAHLADFDVSDNLTLSVQPVINSNIAGINGLTLKLKF